MDALATTLKTLGHLDRLRILALLSHGELTVSEIVQIMGMSQPRITQYIKSLEDVGILERLKEGSWVFSRLNRTNASVSALVATVLGALPENDPALRSDRRRLEDVRTKRAESADAFFADVANDRGQLGDEYLPQSGIDALALNFIGDGPYEFAVDLGTGTGRMLDLLADRVKLATGIDSNTDMLHVARHRLSSRGQSHISFRKGDLRSTPLDNNVADLVTLHQVLHYLDDPEQALRESARILCPGGSLLIIDFARHDFEMFREKYAHRRLGFSSTDIQTALTDAGLTPVRSEKVITGTHKPDVNLWLADKPQRENPVS
ncbi:MAG: metalloregulator ArsR/SmtB family transcription factor [Hyphomonadaceae bacterium]|nr:metalloregulator ArsR/SmtB family transcription factor [Hyphomonadaceae bacterium]MBC6412749.1 metalloregulator ArsR/SmtB family transcription factor [Hyphomonadaceae bacterium]